MKPKVLVATPCRPDSAKYIDFFRSRDALILPEGSKCELFPGFFPDYAINNAVKRAMQDQFTHVFIVDDDQLLHPETINKLLKRNKDIVSVNLLYKVAPFHPYFFPRALEDGRVIMETLQDEAVGLVEVEGVSTGGLLVKTQVFENMQFPWFDTNDLLKTYDIFFSHRAREAGYKLWYDLEIPSGHIVPSVLWPEKLDGKWKTAVVINNSLKVHLPPAKRISPDKVIMEGANVPGNSN